MLGRGKSTAAVQFRYRCGCNQTVWRSTLAASKRRLLPFVSILAADGISGAGNLLARLALPWFVLETTGSASQTAMTVAVGFLPVVATGLLGGALVDRLGYRRMSVISDVASAVSVALIPLLYETVGLEFWQLLALVFLGTVLDSPGVTARAALYPNLATAAGVSLERANTLMQVVRRASNLVAPLLAGLLILWLGPSRLLWLDAATFLFSAAAVMFLVPGNLEKARDAEPSGNYLHQVIEGWRFLRSDRVLTSTMVLAGAASLIAEPVYVVVLPLMANLIYDSPVALGIMFASLAAGSLAGNGYYFWLAPRLPRRGLLLFGFGTRALMFLALPFEPPLEVLCATIFINAFALEPTNSIFFTLFQERTPEGLRGRIFGIILAIVSGSLPLGIMVYGLLAGSFGLATMLAVVAAVNLFVPLVALLAPGFRHIERPTLPEESPAT